MEETQPAVLPVAKSGIRRIDIDPDRSQAPTFGGLSFGSAGQYEKLRGTAYGEIDPADPHNAVITDLHLASVNDRGMVEYSMDIFILKPINLRTGNHLQGRLSQGRSCTLTSEGLSSFMAALSSINPPAAPTLWEGL